MMVDDNWHRDTDKREQEIECTFELIAFSLPEDLTEGVHLLAMIHRPNRIQDDPFYVDDQFYLYTEDTSRSPMNE